MLRGDRHLPSGSQKKATGTSVIVVGEVDIATVRDRSECEAAGALFDRVWQMQSMVPNEVIIATVHAGGYASLARVNNEVVGASWGFLGWHDGTLTLHSHVTGVLANHGTRGLGEALKRHQWQWASEHGVEAITWTFDPLVRRNGYFNLVKLGAVVTAYHENFYGVINDGLNRGEHTDRLLVRWQVAGQASAPHGACVERADWSVATPDDIELLRRTDVGAAREWRSRQRADLRKVFDGSWSIAGYMADGSYAVARR